MRGIAALSVLTLHLPWPTSVRMPLPRSYLAVDLFFLLSGFVIAHAYSHRLGSAQLFKEYCLARVIRLYPLYFLVTLMSAAEVFAYFWFGNGANHHVTAGKIITSLGTAIFLFPTPSRYSVEPITFFPLVFTAWSLFWELWVNLIYGAAHGLLRPAVLALIIIFGAVGIGLAEHIYGVAGGTSWEGAWAGAARALFSYFTGIAVFRVRQRHRAPRTPVLLLAALLVLAFVPATFGGWVYDVVCIAVLFPLLVWLGAEAVMTHKVHDTGISVGFLSYPVYLVQTPLLLWLAPLSVRLERIMPTRGLLQLIVDSAAILLGSWVIARWFDLPVRRWLQSRILNHTTFVPAQSAP